jgi:ABC-type uncharacterized transport system auxiliary subunit
MRRASRAVAALLVAGVLAGCSFARRPPEMRYYTLAVPGTPPASPLAPFDVGAFSADAPYAGTRLAFRTSPYRIEYYVYHRWAADPRGLVAAAARDYLERVPAVGDASPLRLTGRIRRLEEVDREGGRDGALALDIEVRQADEVVLARAYEDTEPAEGANPEATVAAISRALGRILDRVVADLGR